MSKISMLVLVIGLVIGIPGAALFLYGMNSEQSEIPVASISESMNSDENISSEGVKVRGDWEVTVSDPDGSNPTVYNFQNKITMSAFDLISRGLLPADHQDKATVHESGWVIHLWDYYTFGAGVKAWHSCDTKDNGSVLFTELTRSESLKQYLLFANPALGELYDGIMLTGSCLVSEPPADDSDTPIEINKVSVEVKTIVEEVHFYQNFANKFFGWGGTVSKQEDAIIINAPGQMVSMTVNFTFE